LNTEFAGPSNLGIDIIRYKPLIIALSVLCPVCLVLTNINRASGQTSRTSEKKPDIPTVFDTPVSFTGKSDSTVHLKNIRIGVFAPTDSVNPLAAAISNAAALAVGQINSAGGCNGLPFEIITRWADDPWGGGSKKMIKLVYEDSVLAVIGSVDSEATHVAEQIVTKAWLPLISPVSADPTLNYIRIPWMFRLPPNDEEQAKVITAGLQSR
jgi:ABC-type branched-subunit amino acid transport system substrate-binding protein